MDLPDDAAKASLWSRRPAEFSGLAPDEPLRFFLTFPYYPKPEARNPEPCSKAYYNRSNCN